MLTDFLRKVSLGEDLGFGGVIGQERSITESNQRTEHSRAGFLRSLRTCPPTSLPLLHTLSYPLIMTVLFSASCFMWYIMQGDTSWKSPVHIIV